MSTAPPGGATVPAGDKAASVSDNIAKRLDTGLLLACDAVSDALSATHTTARSLLTNHAVPLARSLTRDTGVSPASSELALADIPEGSRLPDLDIKCEARAQPRRRAHAALGPRPALARVDCSAWDQNHLQKAVPSGRPPHLRRRRSSGCTTWR